VVRLKRLKPGWRGLARWGDYLSVMMTPGWAVKESGNPVIYVVEVIVELGR
jgi:hypothetical protein